MVKKTPRNCAVVVAKHLGVMTMTPAQKITTIERDETDRFRRVLVSRRCTP